MISFAEFPGSVLAALVVVSPFILARLRLDSAERSAGAPSGTQRVFEYRYYSADLRAVITPPLNRMLDLPGLEALRTGWSPNLLESTTFIGIILLASVLIVATRYRKSLSSRTALVAFFWLWVCSLGPAAVLGSTSPESFSPRGLLDFGSTKINWLLYRDFAHIPGLVSLRTPNRAGFVVAGVALATAIIAFREASSWRKQTRIVVTFLGLLSLFVSLPQDVPRFSSSVRPGLKETLNKIRDSGPGTVVVAGADCIDSIKLANLQIMHHKAIVGCQTFSASVPWYSGIDRYLRSAPLAALRCEPGRFGLRYLQFSESSLVLSLGVLRSLRQDLGIRWIFLDRGLPCASPVRLDQISGFLSEHTTTLYQDDAGFSVYEIPGLETT